MSIETKKIEATALDEKPKTLWSEAWKRLKRDKIAIMGGIIIIFTILAALLAKFIAPYDPVVQFNNATTSFGMPFPPQSYSKKLVFNRKASNDEFSILPSLIFKDSSATVSYRTVGITKVKKGDTTIEVLVAPVGVNDVTKLASIDMKADSKEDPSRQELVNKINASFDSIKMENDKYFILGTDKQGRDSFSRLIWGAQVSLEVGIISIFFATVIGIVMGLLSGFFGGWVDMLIMRITDIMMSMPDLLLVMALVSVIPQQENKSAQGVGIIIFSIAIISWTGIARLVRSQVFSVKEMEYVEASKAAGSSDFYILFKHVLPNVIAPVIVISTMSIASAVMTEASLSFLGFGVKPPTPSWGSMVNEGLEFFKDAPWVPIIPGAAIAISVFAFNLFGDGVRDALDPKLK